MLPLQRLANYIGRETQQQTLLRWSREIKVSAQPRALYFEAEGGLGKTRLLEFYPAIIHDEIPDMRVARIIDLYDYESRRPNEIERRLIEGLKQIRPEQWYRIPAAEVDTAFDPYAEAHAAYRRAREELGEVQAQPHLEQLRAAFVACWNQLAERYPLVMRFDTIETLFSQQAPPEALVSAAEATTGAGLVLSWLDAILPRLHRTLILFSGRPLKQGRNLLIERLHVHHLLAEPVQTLETFKDAAEIHHYLHGYDVANLTLDTEWLRRITEGRPLLLTCIAEMHRPTFSIPPGIPAPRFDQIHSRDDLENQIIDTILNPLLDPLGRQDLTERTLVCCLYFLTRARRGIQRQNLRDLFERIGLRRDDRVIDDLHRLALIKTIRSWRESARAQPVADTGSRQPAADDLLFLHDEIYQLIDESGKSGEFGLDEPTLDYLCDLSRRQVRQATDRTDLLKAMSDNVYYELTRNFADGYRAYTIYIDWLLRDNSVDEALILSDAFWSTLLYSVERTGRRRPYMDALRQSTRVSYDEILRDEQVRRIKLLRARELNEEAAELTEQLHQQFVAEGLIPTDEAALTPGTQIDDQYLFVDLNLVRASVLIRSRATEYEQFAEDLLSRLIAFLEDDSLVQDEFLGLRRWFFLGEAYTARSYLRYQEQRFSAAEHDSEAGRAAFKRYREQPLPAGAAPPETLLNDRITAELAKATNELSYNLAQSGQIQRALWLSNEVIERFSPHVSDYRRALFFNTRALILIRSGFYLEARAPLRKAEQAAKLSASNRALGLVAQAGLLERTVMRIDGEPQPEIERHFQDARRLLQNEPGALRQVYSDWAGFARDLAVVYRTNSDSRFVILFPKPEPLAIKADCNCACPSSPAAFDTPDLPSGAIVELHPQQRRIALEEGYSVVFVPSISRVAVVNRAGGQFLDRFREPQPCAGCDPDELAAVRQFVRLGLLRERGAYDAPPAPADELVAWLHMTNACNLRCTYCFVDKDEAAMSEEVIVARASPT